MTENEDDYFLPLEDQRVFGAGIKRKRIDFVPAADNSVSNITVTTGSATQKSNVADRYLSIVMQPSEDVSTTTPELRSTKKTEGHPSSGDVCSVCKQPLLPSHESTLAHQVCLDHSHPPSHLDRSRHGVRYLSSYGWDPDERIGLGARAEGLRYPIKPVPKYDTAGLQEKRDLEAEAARTKPRRKEVRPEKPVMVNAKEVRKREQEAKQKAEKLRSIFYGSEDVERYLGTG